ncbi:hypothetical protein [Agrobacterium tumefaciens]|uniref:hypothetical protein n=1 Tax=Agrobacterium tumefaciens TaxID=358 RepID=UPI0015739927|nr:hypothetical protein [Agrobacterium tumefaciens]NTB05901.1 hypothetical protein [Agrobacterium tumefaciens]
MAILTAMILIGRTALEDGPSFNLMADSAQVGQGSTISLDQGHGFITIKPTPAFPQGLEAVVEADKESEMDAIATSHMWTLRLPKQKLDLSFIVVGKAYICKSCVGLGLPLTWSRVEQG